MKFSLGEKIHISGVIRIKVCFFEFHPSKLFLTKENQQTNVLNCWRHFMMNQFVKATTCFSCKLTVNIDFLLLKSALPSPQHNFPLNFLPCSGEEFR